VRIIVAKKVAADADTSVDEARIDEIVFDLYGLTSEERDLVRANSK